MPIQNLWFFPLLRALLLLFALSLLPTVASAQVYLKRLLGVEAPAAAPHRARTAEDSVVALAQAQLGTPYVWGAERPDVGFDCSGLVQYLMRAVGVEVPRVSADQAQAGEEVPKSLFDLRPGDILTFGEGRSITHVGVYIGRGRYIHANSTNGRVLEEQIPLPWLLSSRWWKGARRVLATRGDNAAKLAIPPVDVPLPTRDQVVTPGARAADASRSE